MQQGDINVDIMDSVYKAQPVIRAIAACNWQWHVNIFQINKLLQGKCGSVN